MKIVYIHGSRDFNVYKFLDDHAKTTIDLDEADIAFAQGIKGLNETNKMIIKNTLEALLAKQEKDEEGK